MTTKKDKSKKPEKDTKQVYDWPVLRTEFFQSDFSEVKAFFLNKYNSYTTHIIKQTVNWTREKKAWRKEQADKALEEIAKHKSAKLKKMLDKVTLLIEKKLNDAVEIGYVNADDLKKVWEMIRTENDLPTRIVHQKNDNLNYDAGKVKEGLLGKLKKKLVKSKPNEAA